MKLGFIGCGNMAGAMLGGILKEELLKKDEIIASTSSAKSLQRVRECFGICTALSKIGRASCRERVSHQV